MKAVTTLVALCALCLPAAAQVGGFNPDSVKVRYVWSQLDSDDFTYNHSKQYYHYFRYDPLFPHL